MSTKRKLNMEALTPQKMKMLRTAVPIDEEFLRKKLWILPLFKTFCNQVEVPSTSLTLDNLKDFCTYLCTGSEDGNYKFDTVNNCILPVLFREFRIVDATFKKSLKQHLLKLKKHPRTDCSTTHLEPAILLDVLTIIDSMPEIIDKHGQISMFLYASYCGKCKLFQHSILCWQ